MCPMWPEGLWRRSVAASRVPVDGKALGPSTFHSSERIEEVIQVLGHCPAPGQVLIRDRGRAHGNDERPDLLMLPELPKIGPLEWHSSLPLSSGRQQSVSLPDGCHG